MPPAAESNETPKYNLPPPVNETGSETDSAGPERALASPETAKSPKAPKLSNSKTQLADFNLTSAVSSQPTSVVPATSSTDNPQIADDNDLIEKEWVAKAKKIIEDNREDPFVQSKEMTLFKADYMKKRYNKAIKVSG